MLYFILSNGNNYRIIQNQITGANYGCKWNHKKIITTFQSYNLENEYKHRNAAHSIFKVCIKQGIYYEIFEPIEKTKNIIENIELLKNPEIIRLLTVVNTVINGNDENLENFKGNIKNWIQESIWTV